MTDTTPFVGILVGGRMDIEPLARQTEIDGLNSNGGLLPQPPPIPNENVRTKSALRLRYEAEVEVLKRKLGDLEGIREQLGLSQRKICQLLLVDPSAWTRWTRDGDSAPPHIYRALQWYLAIEEKYPALDVNFWLTNLQRPAAESFRTAEIENTKKAIGALQAQLLSLENEWETRFLMARKKQRQTAIAAVGLLALGIVIGFMLSHQR